MYKILLVDDNRDYFLLIQTYNEACQTNYSIHYLSTGLNIKEYIKLNNIDLILMDWQLENEEDGLSIIQSLKTCQQYNHIPMIIVTAKSELSEQIAGLDGGADDYIIKPFSMELLFSKINSMLRKECKDKNTEEHIKGRFSFFEDKLEIEFDEIRHKLSFKEFTILKILVNEPLKVHSQDELNNLTSGEDVHVSKRCIDTFITILRKKIGKSCILSIRKKGYKINEELCNITPTSQK